MLSPALDQALLAPSCGASNLGRGLRLLAVWRRPMEFSEGRWVRLGTGFFVLGLILLYYSVGVADSALKGDVAVDGGAIAGMVLWYLFRESTRG